MDANEQIIAIKELRRDTDAIIQRVRALPGSSERTLAFRKLQEGVMWLEMDLKKLRDHCQSLSEQQGPQ